jgi:CDP-diacylglycerol pyrophosphatase
MKKVVIVVLLVIALIGVFAALRLHQRDALRRIVQDQCLPNFRQHADPAPCEYLVPASTNPDNGYAILHDRKGGAHFLLIPIRTLTGIESAALLDHTATDYVAAAWRNRDVLERSVHRTLPRDAVGLAINPRTARGQDQLHIHIECVGASLHEALAAHTGDIGSAWSPLTIAGRSFQARRIPGDDFERANPIQLLASQLTGARRDRGSHTLIVAGMNFASGPGVIFLVGTGVPGGERLLDASCAVAH